MRQNTVIAVGKSILNRASCADIGALMLAYGGAGMRTRVPARSPMTTLAAWSRNSSVTWTPPTRRQSADERVVPASRSGRRSRRYAGRLTVYQEVGFCGW